MSNEIRVARGAMYVDPDSRQRDFWDWSWVAIVVGARGFLQREDANEYVIYGFRPDPVMLEDGSPYLEGEFLPYSAALGYVEVVEVDSDTVTFRKVEPPANWQELDANDPDVIRRTEASWLAFQRGIPLEDASVLVALGDRVNRWEGAA